MTHPNCETRELLGGPKHGEMIDVDPGDWCLRFYHAEPRPVLPLHFKPTIIGRFTTLIYVWDFRRKAFVYAPE